MRKQGSSHDAGPFSRSDHTCSESAELHGAIVAGEPARRGLVAARHHVALVPMLKPNGLMAVLCEQGSRAVKRAMSKHPPKRASLTTFDSLRYYTPTFQLASLMLACCRRGRDCGVVTHRMKVSRYASGGEVTHQIVPPVCEYIPPLAAVQTE